MGWKDRQMDKQVKLIGEQVGGLMDRLINKKTDK